MVQRVTYRRRTSYNTPSNRIRKIKTPGGRLVVQYITKKPNGPKCGDCGGQILGIPALRPKRYMSISKRQKTVARAYGGSRCGRCVRDRILRAFLIEERKIAKKFSKAHQQDKKSVPSAQ